MRVTFRVIFNRKKRLNHMGTALVEIVATLQAKRRYFTTNQLITPNEWNVKKKETTIPYINTAIAKQNNELKDFSEKWFVLHDSFKLQDFDSFKSPVPKATKVLLTFTDFFKQQLELEKTKLAFSTYCQQKTALAYFTKFRPKVHFSELSFALIEEFDHFLRSNKLHQNTIHKRHRELKKYVNLAIKYDHLGQSPYDKFKMWKVPVDTMYLTDEERKRFEGLTFTPEDSHLLQIAKDMFLLSCYCGLRYSDVHSLSDTDFETTDKGLELRYKADKTDKSDCFPLWTMFDGKPQRIAQKYMNKGKKRLFYGMTNSKINKELKKLAKLANINKNLHFHASRHTFATKLANELPLTTVQSLMGHSDIKTTSGYLHLSNEKRTEILEQNPIN